MTSCLLRCSTNLKAIGEGRTQMLDVNLENIAKRMGDSASGKSTVDPKGYLTSLDSVQISSDSEINDIKKARMLLKSVINTNPKHCARVGGGRAAGRDSGVSNLAACFQQTPVMRPCWHACCTLLYIQEPGR